VSTPAWVGLAFALVALSSIGPGAAEWVSLTLVLAILYVLLSHSDVWAGPLSQFAASLGGTPSSGAVGGGSILAR